MSIGGQLDLRALARLRFSTLPHAEQLAAIRRASAGGQSLHDIAELTGLAPEQIETVIAEEQPHGL